MNSIKINGEINDFKNITYPSEGNSNLKSSGSIDCISKSYWYLEMKETIYVGFDLNVVVPMQYYTTVSHGFSFIDGFSVHKAVTMSGYLESTGETSFHANQYILFELSFEGIHYIQPAEVNIYTSYNIQYDNLRWSCVCDIK